MNFKGKPQSSPKGKPQFKGSKSPTASGSPTNPRKPAVKTAAVSPTRNTINLMEAKFKTQDAPKVSDKCDIETQTEAQVVDKAVYDDVVERLNLATSLIDNALIYYTGILEESIGKPEAGSRHENVGRIEKELERMLENYRKRKMDSCLPK